MRFFYFPICEEEERERKKPSELTRLMWTGPPIEALGVASLGLRRPGLRPVKAKGNQKKKGGKLLKLTAASVVNRKIYGKNKIEDWFVFNCSFPKLKINTSFHFSKLLKLFFSFNKLTSFGLYNGE